MGRFQNAKQAFLEAAFLIHPKGKGEMAKKKYFSFYLGSERKILEKLARVEKGRVNYSATIRRLIREEAVRAGLVPQEKS